MALTREWDHLASLFQPPTPPDRFVNRSPELLELVGRVRRRETRPTVVLGPAGVGKTALAAHFVTRALPDGTLVVWFTPAMLEALPSQASDVMQALQGAGAPALVVLDDAVDADQIRSVTSSASNVHTLVTTRHAALGEMGNAIALGPLPPREAAELLRGVAPKLTEAQAVSAVAWLGGLPVALELAGRVIALAGWIAFKKRFGGTSESSGQKTGASSREAANRARADAARGIGLLKRGEYSEASVLLESASNSLQDSLGADHEDVLAVRAGLADAYRLSGDSVKAIEILRDLIQLRRSAGASDEGILPLEANLGAALRDSGQLQEAADVLLPVVRGMERTFGSSHPDVIQAKTSLAVVWADMGDLAQAAAVQEDALGAAVDSLGREHRLTLTALGNLASLRAKKGDLQGAGGLQQELLHASIRALGLDHPDTLTALSNLASTRYSEGQFLEALDMETAVLERRRDALGPDHPHTLAAANNLAFTLRQLGRLEEAGLAADTAISGYRVLSESNPQAFAPRLLTSLMNRADMLVYQERTDEALALMEEAVTTARTLTETESDPLRWDSADAIARYGELLLRLGRPVAAVAALEEAVQLYQQAPHLPPKVGVGFAIALARLAEGLTATRRLDEAVINLRESLAVLSASRVPEPVLNAQLSNLLSTLTQRSMMVNDDDGVEVLDELWRELGRS